MGSTGGAIAEAATFVSVELLLEPLPPPVADALPPVAVWDCPCCWPCDWLLLDTLLLLAELLEFDVLLLVLVFVLLTPVTGVGVGGGGGFFLGQALAWPQHTLDSASAIIASLSFIYPLVK